MPNKKRASSAPSQPNQPPRKINSTRLPCYADVVRAYLDWGSSHGGRRGGGWSGNMRQQRENQLSFWQERLSLELLTDLGNQTTRIETIRRELTDDYGLSRKTADEYYSALMSFVRWAHDNNYIQANPLRRLAPLDKRPQRHIRPLSRDELARLITASGPNESVGVVYNHRLLYLTAAYSGLIVHELRELNKTDLDARRRCIIIRYGEQMIPSWLADDLAEYVQTNYVGRLYSEKANKNLPDRLFYMPGRPQDMIYRHMDDVGIARQTSAGTANMRSLRFTYIAMLDDLHLRRSVRHHLARVQAPPSHNAPPPSDDELREAVERLDPPSTY